MKKIILTVYSNEELTYKDKANYIGKAFSGKNSGGIRLNFLEKFNNALGYQGIEETETSIKPYTCLLSGMEFLNRKNEIMTFIVDDFLYEFSDSKYTYDTLSMILKFQKFLYKIFPNQIHIELDIKEEFTISLRDFVLSRFMIVKAEADFLIPELSIPRKLRDKEKEYILSILRHIMPVEPQIECYLCKACFKHNPETPYHIELL